MKLTSSSVCVRSSEAAYALLSVMILCGVAILLYASAARWTASSKLLNDRNNVYNQTVQAAEAASEQALTYVSRDFLNQSFDPAHAADYGDNIPAEGWAARYLFTDGQGGSNRTFVGSSSALVLTNLDSQFPGLYGMVYACKLRSNARPMFSSYDFTAGVEQTLQLAAIPVFQFAIFYGMDMEINPGPVMKITGKVHSNQNIYTAPVAGLEYQDAVTAVGRVYNNRSPSDPTASTKVPPVYDTPYVEHVSSLTLPIGTNNSPLDVRAILEPSPPTEDPLSPTGMERYYNKCALMVTASRTSMLVSAGRWDSFATVLPDVPAGTNGYATYSFVKTNGTFFDARESKSTMLTEIDIAALAKWMTNAGTNLNALCKVRTGHQLNSIYVEDQRAVAGRLTAVRVVNGAQLPPDGLTVATRLPLYVKGHFNAPVVTVGSTNTTLTKPSSLLGDAVTVLSTNWSDANSSKTLAKRPASDTTVNAAFLAGIVPSTNSIANKHYSGGVENFPRFLEDWTGKTFTYNGSMVVLFPSQFATSFWIDPGTYYNAPTRKWAFDLNFLTFSKLPPETPMVRKLIRGEWTVVAAAAPNS
jgi:hypothetical protein